MQNLDQCHVCEKPVSNTATTCPHCGSEGERIYRDADLSESFEGFSNIYMDIPIGKRARAEEALCGIFWKKGTSG